MAPPWLPVPPVAYGGTESVVDVLARGFAAAGHDVVLYATGDSTCPVPTSWVYPRACTERIGNGVVGLRHVIHAYAALADRDVVHDHTQLGPLYAGHGRGPRLVSTCHGPLDGELADVYRAIAAVAPVVGISRAQVGHAPFPVARVIHHGIDPSAFAAGGGKGDYLVFVGRMTPDKGVATAIRIARAAGRELRIAAKMREPDELAYFQAEITPLLGEDVVYLGEPARRELQDVVGGAAALLNPIQWAEPFGLVMVEALGCGTPVLATAVGSAPEIVTDGVTGFLRRDADDLVGCVDRLGEIDRAACRRAVEDRFSADRMVRDYLAFFQQLLCS